MHTNNTQKHPPYDTGKLKIGVYYETPKRQHQSREELLIQDVLLGGSRPMFSFALFKYAAYVVCGVVAYMFALALAR